jgi:hypothetical protein
VLDFVGHHRKEFRFDRRFRALLGGSRKDLESQITEGFPFLPAGCHIELDRVARELVLENIRAAVPSRWPEKVEELRLVARGDNTITLQRFLDETGLEPEDIFTGRKTFSHLREDAGLSVRPAGPHEELLRQACARLLHINDFLRIDSYRRWLSETNPPNLTALSRRERQLVRMLVASVADRAINKKLSLEDACGIVWAHPQVRVELLDLLEVLAGGVGHVQHTLVGHPEVPLLVHARYTRLEILAAFGIGEHAKVAPWQTGVYWAKDAALICSPSRWTRRLGSSRPRHATATTPSAATSSIGRVSRPLAPTAKPDGGTGSTRRWDHRSCCLRGCAATTGRFGSSGRRTT